jgi:cytochrome c biogenesis protein CcdA/thiol-disulfide isomerase/thioredoxin
MFILCIFAFFAGLLTVLAPCIWPLLPVILSSDVNQNGRRRPLGLVTGVTVSFGLLTLGASALERSVGISEQSIRTFSVIVLVAMGLLLLLPPLTLKFESKISEWVGRFAPKSNQPSSGFIGGFVVGLSLGILWTPCSGPIFAAISTASATSKISFAIFLVTLAYLLGVSIPLYLLVIGGRKLLNRIKVINRYLGKIQIVSGLVLISFALATATGFDKTLEIKLLNHLPSYTNFLTSFEKQSSVTKQLSKLTGRANEVNVPVDSIKNDLLNFSPSVQAPEIVGDKSWINSAPLKLVSLKGHVVLVDFWTYTCINCIRSLQYVKKWYATYHSAGLEVIGVHSPEFPFEQSRTNVIAAVHRFGIKYPVVQDNKLATWNNFNNQYWPAEYLIDSRGFIRRADFGEGNYDQMESAIQLLLKQKSSTSFAPVSNPMNVSFDKPTSLETYLGVARFDQAQNPYQFVNAGTRNFQATNQLAVNTYEMSGKWRVSDLNIESQVGSNLSYHFTAHQVYVVLKPSNTGKDLVRVMLNGKPMPTKYAGTDVKDGVIRVDADRLYNLFDSKSLLTDGLLKLDFATPGTQAFTFTFG